ncbi:hypothetical protein M1247_22620 [Mycobacterium sp. 21AC1]|uniref:hypothetical protein n=1 Tax=[Mycobacterium] appelbergii TaxID=2939269 RepID=UPI002938D835|nr:hypothetical protein [Mycobacterium sp. 21AC1]MDV3127730.1 hypothetical protein [Mycobacterium sp. 21AC1]
MSFVALPSTQLSDEDVAAALERTVGLIDLLLDALSGFDPLGLRGRTHHRNSSGGVAGKVLDAAAAVLDIADVPGTRSWDRMDRSERINWWVRRVGALDTVLVAFPGVYGAIADRLPIQDFLGFSNQAMVLCAVAREHGVTDRDSQVRLLGAVLCERDLTADGADGGATPLPQPESSSDPTPLALAKKLWELAAVMRAISAELAKRPHPQRIFHYFGMLPAVGAIADYLGEYGALRRAAEQGEAWIAEYVGA